MPATGVEAGSLLLWV